MLLGSVLLQCEELWRGKAHIPRLSKLRGASKLAAYSMSIMDGKRVSNSSSFFLGMWLHAAACPVLIVLLI